MIQFDKYFLQLGWNTKYLGDDEVLVITVDLCNTISTKS